MHLYHAKDRSVRLYHTMDLYFTFTMNTLLHFGVSLLRELDVGNDNDDQSLQQSTPNTYEYASPATCQYVNAVTAPTRIVPSIANNTSHLTTSNDEAETT